MGELETELGKDGTADGETSSDVDEENPLGHLPRGIKLPEELPLPPTRAWTEFERVVLPTVESIGKADTTHYDSFRILSAAGLPLPGDKLSSLDPKNPRWLERFVPRFVTIQTSDQGSDVMGMSRANDRLCNSLREYNLREKESLKEKKEDAEKEAIAAFEQLAVLNRRKEGVRPSANVDPQKSLEKLKAIQQKRQDLITKQKEATERAKLYTKSHEEADDEFLNMFHEGCVCVPHDMHNACADLWL